MDVIIRPASFADLQAIYDINHDIFRGHDYLYNFYYPLLHSGKYFPFVAVVDGKIVSLVSYYIDQSTQSAYGMAGRTKPEYDGKGLTHKMRQFAYEKLQLKFPWLKWLKTVPIGSPRQAEYLAKHKNISVVQEWRYALFMPSYTDLKRITQDFPERSSDGRLITFGSAMSMVPQITSFLHQHVTHIGLYQFTFIPQEVNSGTVQHMLRLNDVIMTKNDKGDITSLSALNSLKNSQCAVIGISFFGAKAEDLLNHIQIAVNKIINILDPESYYYCSICLNIPTVLDCNDVMEKLEQWFGEQNKLNDGQNDIRLTKARL